MTEEEALSRAKDALQRRTGSAKEDIKTIIFSDFKVEATDAKTGAWACYFYKGRKLVCTHFVFP